MTGTSRASATPPAARTLAGQGLTAASTQEQPLLLQTCGHCHLVQYPPRELCRHCLGDQLSWEAVENGGTLVSRVELAHSLIDFFQQRLPWVIGSIKLDCRPLVMAHLTPELHHSGVRVKLFAHADVSGSAVLVAVSAATDIDIMAQRMQYMQALELVD